MFLAVGGGGRLADDASVGGRGGSVRLSTKGEVDVREGEGVEGKAKVREDEDCRELCCLPSEEATVRQSVEG